MWKYENMELKQENIKYYQTDLLKLDTDVVHLQCLRELQYSSGNPFQLTVMELITLTMIINFDRIQLFFMHLKLLNCTVLSL